MKLLSGTDIERERDGRGDRKKIGREIEEKGKK